MRRFFSANLLPLLAALPLHAQFFEPVPFPKPLFRPDTATLVFLGDVMLHREQLANAWRPDAAAYDFSTFLVKMKPLLEGADVAVANMEFTLAGAPYTGYPCFSAPDSYAEYVADCGVDIFLTANNHILDKGKKGIGRTLATYRRMEEERGIKYTGTALDAQDDSLRNPLVVVARGVRIALVNFTCGTNVEIADPWPKVRRTDTAEIAAAVRRAKDARVDFIVALPHWGTEYVLRHSASQGRLARWLAETGCDAVIGAHPHVVQDVEVVTVPCDNGIGVREVPVVYSLGNAVSNMSAVNTRIGLAITLRIATDKTGKREMLPLGFTLTWCTRPGTLTRSYCTVPVKEYSRKREEWLSDSDFRNMTATWERVKAATGIEDGTY